VKKAHAIVYGKVQGVYYRASAREKALSLHLSGWVRNLSDGSVEVQYIGSDESVDEMCRWLWIGPKNAKVEDVKIDESIVEAKEKNGFHVIH
jgi:acylphosphatase